MNNYIDQSSQMPGKLTEDKSKLHELYEAYFKCHNNQSAIENVQTCIGEITFIQHSHNCLSGNVSIIIKPNEVYEIEKLKKDNKIFRDALKLIIESKGHGDIVMDIAERALKEI